MVYIMYTASRYREIGPLKQLHCTWLALFTLLTNDTYMYMECLHGLQSLLSDPVAKKTEPTPVDKAAGHVPTSHESKDSKRGKPGGDERQKRDGENREQDKLGAVSDIQAGKNEQVLAAGKVGGAKGGERNEDKTGKVQQTLEKHAEEGEIPSQSPTPNSRQPKKVSTQRCYMDEEQPSKTKKEKSKQDQ